MNFDLLDLQAVEKRYCTSDKDAENAIFANGEFNYRRLGTFLIIT